MECEKSVIELMDEWLETATLEYEKSFNFINF